MNVPNILTALRLVLIPFFAYYLYTEQYSVAVVLFILGGLTDFLDGYIARRYNIITNWGKIADPIADKLMQITALVLLTYQDKLPVSVLIIVIAKEIFLGIGSILLYKKEKFVVSANWYGKLATVLFFVAIIVAMRNDPHSYITYIFVVIAVISTLFAFFMYSLSYRRIRSDNK